MAIVQNTETDTPFQVNGAEELFTIGDILAAVKLMVSMGYQKPIYFFKDGNLMTNSREFAIFIDHFWSAIFICCIKNTEACFSIFTLSTFLLLFRFF